MAEVAHVDSVSVEELLDALRVSWNALSRAQFTDNGVYLVVF